MESALLAAKCRHDLCDEDGLSALLEVLPIGEVKNDNCPAVFVNRIIWQEQLPALQYKFKPGDKVRSKTWKDKTYTIASIKTIDPMTDKPTTEPAYDYTDNAGWDWEKHIELVPQPIWRDVTAELHCTLATGAGWAYVYVSHNNYGVLALGDKGFVYPKSDYRVEWATGEAKINSFRVYHKETPQA